MNTEDTSVGDIVAAVSEAFPVEWAEPWDAVGLLVGDPAALVKSVFVSLDVTYDSVRRALAAGANVLATHHPAFLTPPARLTLAAGGPAYTALASGLALIAAHTNLDRSPKGAGALPALLGLDSGAPLEESQLPLASVVVYVPVESAGKLEAAMIAAGAGRVGRYDGCTFAAPGTGAFTPRADATPFVGAPQDRTRTEELRLETVCPRDRANAVVSAIRSAHPYEEPLIVVTDVGIGRGDARMGRVCDLPEPVTLDVFAGHIGDRVETVPRIRGERSKIIGRVAVATGSASSLVGAAIAADVDALVAGEVRYHDAVTAAEAGVAVVELGHDISEWPLVPVLAEAIRASAALPAERVIVDRFLAGYWTP